MKKLVAKNADDNNKKLDNVNASCLASATAIKSLILLTQNQTRLNAIQVLINGNQLFPDYSSYGYISPNQLCNDLITLLKTFNKNNGYYVSDLNSRKIDSNLHKFIEDCIHGLTGMKPRIAVHTDGKNVIWRE